jgi:hypothetical protein
VRHEIIAAVTHTGGYTIEQTPVGLVLTRKSFPTWRILLLGLPALVLGRRAELVSVTVEELGPGATRVSVTGRLVSWMRTDLRDALEALGATPSDFARRKRAQPQAVPATAGGDLSQETRHRAQTETCGESAAAPRA